MDRWEYCYVDLLNYEVARLTPEGLKRTSVRKDKTLPDDTKSDATARVVAQMGLEGWEMTNGAGDVKPVLFFKRRVSG